MRYDQVWKIVPVSTPKIIRKCSRCSGERFKSSDKFRINANKKILDVWLIYKCTQCDFTLNYSIFSRKSVSNIDQTLLTRLSENDVALSWNYAFDTSILQGVQLDWNIEFLIQCHTLKETETLQKNTAENCILITCDYFLKIPIFSVLRKKMELSRDQLEKLYESGELAVHRLKGEKLVLKSIIGKDCTLGLCLGPAYACIVT